MFTFVNTLEFMNTKELSELFEVYKTKALFGRYITNAMIAPLVKNLGLKYAVAVLGQSVENRPIYSLTIGHGATKVLLWSQMHGNESTTTKALFDLMSVFHDSNALNTILDACTLTIVPILNPDGAERYTRSNANAVDLNRDAQELSQPESKILRTLFDALSPDYCLNLHGQRTIFGAGANGQPATLSFLTPAEDDNRTVTDSRKASMAVIASIFTDLKDELPNAIGRYDDGYNLNCVGDTFQSLQVPTLLFEAGHYPNDYEREITRKYVFMALASALLSISKGVNTNAYDLYFEIPENAKNYYDVIIRNAKLHYGATELTDIAIQFKEKLATNKVEFVPIVETISNLNHYKGHKEIHADGHVVLNHLNKPLKVADEIVFVMLNNHKILLKS